jgi:hypothetical protein
MKNEWTAPEWMIPLVEYIKIKGKYTVDDLMNDTSTKWEENPAKTLHIISVRAQVKLLNTLHEAGII